MTSVSKRILASSASRDEDLDDDYAGDYSFAVEYNGPPIDRDIPQLVPVDIHRIPTASMAAVDTMLNTFQLPVLQPIDKSDQSSKISSGESNSGSQISVSQEIQRRFGNFTSSVRVSSRKSENGSPIEESSAVDRAQTSSSSTTSRFFDCHDDPSRFSVSSDVEVHANSSNPNSKGLEFGQPVRETIENSADEPCTRTPAVTSRALPSSDGVSEESHYDEPEPDIHPETRPAVPNEGKNGTCHKCRRTNRFAEREVCIVCGAKYCRKCVLRAMGSMPEGRKCITCIGCPIDESKRGLLGKCSRMLKKALNSEAVMQIMSDEMRCEANQLPPHLIFVNDKALSIEELLSLQRCGNPPKKLRPGRYWYDNVSGFWGKEGEKPSQIISSQLALGYQIRQDASNGDTNVMMNNREITKPELWMLQKRVKILCAALSLPFPSDASVCGDGDSEKDADKSNAKIPEYNTINKLLLVGCDQSGTSTIFKQAKIVYNVPFSDDEKQNIKLVIQRNVYHYLCILLEGHARFEEEYSIEARRQRAQEPRLSDYSEQVDERNIYSFTPRLRSFSDWLLQVMISGNLEVIFPAATREFSPVIEELWKDKAFQATYERRNELLMLPIVANYFLDRAVEITRIDYEPSQMDILYADGLASSNGVASMEFYFPKSSQDGYVESSGENGPPISYQLVRVHANNLRENSKWLSMFEDINLVIYCVSLTSYDEYYEDVNGIRTNKMLATKKLFETIITHKTLADKEFLLVLNKFDLLEEKIQRVPLSHCEWFHDFNPVISHHHRNANTNNNYNSSLAQRAFHYVAVKFKRLFSSLTGRKMFVSRTTGLEGDSVDRALRYCKEILNWSDEVQIISFDDWSSDESMEPST